MGLMDKKNLTKSKAPEIAIQQSFGSMTRESVRDGIQIQWLMKAKAHMQHIRIVQFLSVTLMVIAQLALKRM
ncbi:MAG: hypothetical protein EAY75_17765 [Bacteroidetes bacterium]|nr:MAG: hypothetical protein EAY75_17765 [Bacteroidota bacterium]